MARGEGLLGTSGAQGPGTRYRLGRAGSGQPRQRTGPTGTWQQTSFPPWSTGPGAGGIGPPKALAMARRTTVRARSTL